jgi:Xaa-Pro aminopeptidase
MSHPDKTVFARRRTELLQRMGAGVLVIPSAPTFIRNNDVEHEYRQDSDFYYLTGFDEPESVLVLTSQHEAHSYVLFVRPRDPERETWDGPRAGVQGAIDDYGAAAAFAIDAIQTQLPNYVLNVPRLHYRLGVNEKFDATLIEMLAALRRRARRGDHAPYEIVDPEPTLHEMRLRKSESELATMKEAASITAEAHLAAMRVATPGAAEYQVEAALLEAYHRRGAVRPAYGSIVGSGPNATILHYRANRRTMQQGDLLLIDAGAEYQYYACDVTRTLPVGGRYSDEQRVIYETVLDAQKAAIAAAQVGSTLDDVHHAAVEVIVDGLRSVGLLHGSREEILRDKTYQRFYMHRTSHWLGMDVHDVGSYYVDRAPRPLDPGFVLTVEPGIYIAPNAEVDPKWRGIGVRIEDDVVVTKHGPEVLTASIPKEIDDVQAWMGRS